MRTKTLAVVASLATALGGGATATALTTTTPPTPGQAVLATADNDTAQPATHPVRVRVNDVHGRQTADVTIIPLAHNANLITVRAWNLTPGFHAIHIHSTGLCDPNGAKPFTSAGGHFNPTNTSEGMQAGAFPVLLAGQTGQAQTQFTDTNFTLKQLRTTTGTSIIIHASPDNYANIPTRYQTSGHPGPDTETQMTGDAGTRIACGVIFPITTGAH